MDRKPGKIIYRVCDLEFKTIKALALHFGKSPKTVCHRINKKGWSEEEALGMVPRKDATSISFQGKTYASFNEMCRSHHVNPEIARNRIKRGGWSLEEALELKKRHKPNPITVGNRQFDGWADACRFYDLKVGVVRNRVNVGGWSIEEAFEIVPRPEKATKFMIQGNAFVSFTEMCRFYGKDESVVRSRINRLGWSLEESLEIEPRKARAIGVRGFVYKITHVETGLSYIGITKKNVEERWKEHVERSIQEELNDESGISLALRQCGPEAFLWEVIDTAMNLGELESKERHYIATLNTVEPNGFNRNKGGAGTRTEGIKVSVEGVLYPSIRAAAEVYGVNPYLACARLERGWKPHEIFVLGHQENPPVRKAHNRIPMIVQDIEYESKDAVAKHFGIPYYSLDNRLRRGWTIEQAVGLEPPPPRGNRHKDKTTLNPSRKEPA